MAGLVCLLTCTATSSLIWTNKPPRASHRRHTPLPPPFRVIEAIGMKRFRGYCQSSRLGSIINDSFFDGRLDLRAREVPPWWSFEPVEVQVCRLFFVVVAAAVVVAVVVAVAAVVVLVLVVEVGF